MNKTMRWMLTSWLLLAIVTSESGAWQQGEDKVPQWIWHSRHQAGHVPKTSCYFRKSIKMSAIRSAQLGIAADDQFELYVNGRRVHSGKSTDGITTLEIGSELVQGNNVLAVRVNNVDGDTAGLVGRLVVTDTRGQRQLFVTDSSWKASLSSGLLWTRTNYRDRRWSAAQPFGPLAQFVKLQQQTALAKKGGAPPVKNPAGSSVASNQPAQQANKTQPSSKPKPKPTVAATAPLKREPASGQHLEVPREFQVEHVAGHRDVGSLTAITFDAQGRLIAAREDGQLWMLVDSNQDGQIDERRDLGKLTDSCQGLLSLGSELYVTGKGSTGVGVYRFIDRDGDAKFDEARSLLSFVGENLEHGPHGMTLGPDGMIYVMVGNHSTVESASMSGTYRTTYEGDLVQPRLQDPGGHANSVSAPGGFVIRMDREGKQVEHIAGGLRNAYDLAFNSSGDLFTHDSDMESDRGTTWYRPTRVYHVTEGAEFGWRSGWAKWPDYYLDALPGLVDTGRGSPTGMVVYAHQAFPLAYDQAIFSADWSEGQIYVIPTTASKSGYQASAKPFVRGTPLNATDLEIGPDGALYIATGGRGTAGNVFRVYWKGYEKKMPPTEAIEAVVQHPQPNSNWARQRIQVLRSAIGEPWEAQLTGVVKDASRPDAQRIRALRIMQWFGPQPKIAMLRELSSDLRPAIREQAAYYLGLHRNPVAQQRLEELIEDSDARVRRRACESLARVEGRIGVERLASLLTSEDRLESWSARMVLEQQSLNDYRSLIQSDNVRIFLTASTAALRKWPSAELANAVLQRSTEWMDGFMNDRDFVDLLRLQQLAMIRGKLKPKELGRIGSRLALEYPSSSPTINRELVRLLIFLQEDSVMDRYITQLQVEDSELGATPEKVHLAIHLTFLQTKWSREDRLAVFEHLSTPANSGNSLPGYLQEAAHRFSGDLTPDELLEALARGPENPSGALAALMRLPDLLSGEQLDAVRQLDQDLLAQDDSTYQRLKVGIVAILGRDGRREACRYLRTIYDRDPTRRVAVALSMAATNDVQNWPYLVRSLSVLEPVDAKEIITKLRTFTRYPSEPEPYRQVILAAERLKGNGAKEAIALLEYWQRVPESPKNVGWSERVRAWKAWYANKFPDAPPAKLIVTQHEGKWDVATLVQHLQRAKTDGSGSVERGRNVFAKAKCVNCHRFGSDGESMGPELTTVRKRFLTRELLESIIYPSKVISDQYIGKTVVTSEGELFTGIVAETDAELVILQSNGQKRRIPRDEVDDIEPSRISAMPEGLLDSLSLEEVTDLFAFLNQTPTDRMTRAQSSSETR